MDAKLRDYLFNNRQILVVPSGNENNELLAATALKNLENMGFTIGKRGYELLSTATSEDIQNWYYDTEEKLKEITGGNHRYKPFYPNFPEQVMNLSELDRFIDQISHYIFGYKPEEVNKKENVRSLEPFKLKVLEVFEESKEEEAMNLAEEIFKNTINTKMTLDPATLRDAVNAYMSIDDNWMDKTSNMTNRNLISYLYVKAINEGFDTHNMPKLVANDYIKIAKLYNLLKEYESSASSFKNFSFDEVENEKIKSLPNKMRRFIAEGLNKVRNLEEDVARDKSGFKALFRGIHIGEYKKLNNVNEVARKLRAGEPLETFYSKMEKFLRESRAFEATNLLEKRPGEFIKKFSRLYASIESIQDKKLADITMLNFKQCLEKVSKEARLEDIVSLSTYLDSRLREGRLPIHNVNGNLFLSDKDPYINLFRREDVKDFQEIIKAGIKEQVKDAPEKYGRVYIEPDMYKMKLPSNIKDKSDTPHGYTKGSRLPIEGDKNIRFFIWWTNTETRKVDIDLSANIYGHNGQAIPLVDFNDNGKSIAQICRIGFSESYNSFGCTHSGDIINGGNINGNGACEYIDVDFNKLKEKNAKYVQMYVNVYSGDTFHNLPNAEFGWQERKELDKSAQFNIKAVKSHSKCNGDYMGLTPIIIDVDNKEVIWVDSPDYHARTASTQHNATPISILMEKYAVNDGISMGEYANLVAVANGSMIVDTPEEADTLFMVNEYEDREDSQRVITSKDQDIWLGEMLVANNNNETPELKLEKEITPEDISNEDALTGFINDISSESFENDINNETEDVQTEEEDIDLDEDEEDIEI